MVDLPVGCGDIYLPPMFALIAKAGSGVLTTSDGGEELLGLYRNANDLLHPATFNEFTTMCVMGDLEGVKNAVESGNAPPLTGTDTPLKFGYATLVVVGSQRSLFPDKDWKPLHSATLKFLLQNGCPPDVPDVCRRTALSPATEIPEGNVDLARILISHGADVNHRDIFGMTPISGAVMTAHSKAVDVLMEHGADLDITDADGLSTRDNYIRSGPKVAAVIHAWERRRAGEKAPLGEKGCSLCGKDGKLLFCSACHSVRYCSSDCQKKDWKEHKQSCKRFSGSNTVTVKPLYEMPGFPFMNLIPMQQLARAASGLPSQFPEARTASSNKQMEYPKKKIIKVQVPAIPGSNGQLMVYDAKRELLCYILRRDAPAAYDRLTELVRSKGTFGLKAYLVAELKSKDELVIKIDEVLAEQPF